MKNVKSEDFELLFFDNGVLYNNVFAKNNIQGAFQQVFVDDNIFGWEWDWPNNTGASVKTYPEVILGKSPWSTAKFGSKLPCRIDQVQHTLDFDFTSSGNGSWCDSFDFWITSNSDPTTKDITCNLCLWINKHQIESWYVGRHEFLEIDSRKYNATIETPADKPGKTWNTLFLEDTVPRSKGSIDLKPLLQLILGLRLAKPEHFLSTAELGNEIVYGKGKNSVKTFIIR